MNIMFAFDITLDVPNTYKSNKNNWLCLFSVVFSDEFEFIEVYLYFVGANVFLNGAI
ncbi:hypothetical protein THMIRHAM_06170 [Thiomicrorhabdus immobilis]|uniref:Uncharacterized protein n=1 Tax=Thiomicrorhabdus immobilis TaxID=2791037 RepID=A0ABM7MBW7_9GAMM|nr:hypothetical protein THMIRHAM_06170 [Thiomicrorhabdus immobilis]